LPETQVVTTADPVDYFDTPGLSHSGIKDLMVSPLRYWHLWISPNRPERRETQEMRIGTALHCAALQSSEFESRYACAITPEDFEGCLVTVDDMREWLQNKNVTSTFKSKAAFIGAVKCIDPSAPIFDDLKRLHEESNAGKIILPREDYDRVRGATDSLVAEPALRAILADKDGKAEVCVTATDPETGVPLKARMDWIAPKLTLDLKTFSQQRGKSIDKCVTNAIFYEGYYRQAYFYSLVRALAEGNRGKSAAQTAAEFVLAFVESEAPYEVRIRALRPKSAGQSNLYWDRARVECREAIRLYAKCWEQFGEKPWREPRSIDPLYDEELSSQLAYA
jgi:hypothetical protein